MTSGHHGTAGPAAFALLPDAEWPRLAPFWAGTRAGEIRFPKCTECGTYQWYPRLRCSTCHAGSFAWTAVRPVGSLYSYTIVRRPFVEEMAPLLPLTVAIVDIADAPGVRLVTNLRGELPRIGELIGIAFERVDDRITMPVARALVR